MKIHEIEPWNNAKIVEFYVNCFERTMIIVFKDFNNFNESDIEDMLDELYYNWHDNDEGECCEEYMLERLSEEYKNNIVCVIYEELEDEENEC